MVVTRNNRVVRLTGFSDKKMHGLLFGPQKSGRNNRVVLLTGWSYGRFHCNYLQGCSCPKKLQLQLSDQKHSEYTECEARFSNFYLSKLLCIFPSLFAKNLNKA